MRISRLSYLFIFTSYLLLSACQTVPIAPLQTMDYPISFEAAIQTLTNHLLQNVATTYPARQGLIVLDPFIDAKSGDVLKISREIETVMIAEGKKYFPQFSLIRLTPTELRRANYVLNGTIDLQNYSIKTDEETQGEKYYRLSASVIDLSTGLIIANAHSWIAEADIDYSRTPLYEESPTFLKDKRVQSQITTTESPTGKNADDEYYDSLDTNALLVEAETAYEANDYVKSRTLFNKAAERTDGQVMKTYLGLYESTRQGGSTLEPAAETAFTKLLTLSIQETKSLNIRFLFEVNSTAFINNTKIRQQYADWLRMISHFLQQNDYCFHIVGHSSKTGKQDYNLKLSLQRAESVRHLLATDTPDLLNKSKAIGKGFAENLVGTGTDDAHDAIDRRVEFMMIDCSKLTAE
ncbi:OmpA family protein [Beggiatoa leptomitoformis]|nr:OmpA family protein [Beggiatoa leptomitoformis]